MTKSWTFSPIYMDIFRTSATCLDIHVIRFIHATRK